MNERVVVVTGGNRGIGLEICQQLAKLDLIVVLTSRHEKDGLEAVENSVNRNYPCVIIQLDVTNPTQILKLKDFLTKEFGRCDGLVNNAGIFLDKQRGEFL
jgi:(+)-neomenthol dehydrogenase